MGFIFVEKATKAQRRGTSLAARAERRFAPTLIQALRSLRDRTKVATVARAISEDNVEGVLEATRVSDVASIIEGFTAELPDAVESGAAQAARQLGLTSKATVRKQVFDMGRPLIARWLREHGAELVVQITDASRAGIRSILEDGVMRGRHPRRMAQDIKQVIGLHRRQVDAVIRRRLALEAEGVSPKRVKEITDRYAERLLEQRAQLIAKNEALVAVNRGRYELWQQLAEDGAIDPTMEQRWDTAEDEGVCTVCGPMNGQRRKLDEPFTAGTGGVVDHPPAHIGCRCVVGLTEPSDR